MSTTPERNTPKLLHPFCNACGWRKGGIDSWDGKACKCGYYSPRFELLLTAPETKQ